MKVYLLIALGSAAGGVARHWCSTFVAARWPGAFPWGTFLVNLSGAFLIGIVSAAPDGKFLPTSLPREALTVGLLGGFTTFSAFSLQTVVLLQEGRVAVAAGYVLSSVILCVLGAWLGMMVAR